MTLRPIKPISLAGLHPKAIASDLPQFEWHDPKSLLVEDDYQRRLGKRSIKLIRKISEEFNWLHIKPPVCARGEDGKLFVVDGQHTAIAAASREIPLIPVMIMTAPELERRARAFVAHNVDRLKVTPLQLFASRVAAQDPSALAAQRTAAAAGVRLCRTQPGSGQWEVGDTVAFAAIERLIAKQGEDRTIKILKTLVAAKRAPVVVTEILAVAACLYNPKFGWIQSAFDLVTVIRSKSAASWQCQIMAMVKDGETISLWRSLAEAWVRASITRLT